ncbi:hypothetical protein F2Q69_00032697 [Brassica cretica]|uniref:Uncharacterized protein n=1 Tax=Brassica cretica TaxID=69181 RepID=A0A8S9SBL1_BRACR|nr:hypothetical protein F2Q69_00032697 [Brassica cretica]
MLFDIETKPEEFLISLSFALPSPSTVPSPLSQESKLKVLSPRVASQASKPKVLSPSAAPNYDHAARISTAVSIPKSVCKLVPSFRHGCFLQDT